MVECIWSPNMIMFNKIKNKKNLWDKRFQSYERAVTFDGNEVFVEKANINGSGICNILKNILNSIN